MRATLVAALLAAITFAPTALAGTVPGPICVPVVGVPPTPPLHPWLAPGTLVPGPYATSVAGPCGAGGGLVSSTAPACPPVPPIPGSTTLAGEYCGDLYLAGETVKVTAFAALSSPETTFGAVMGFDAFPYDGHLDATETTCMTSVPPVPSPIPFALKATQCMAPLGPVPVYRLIVWIVPDPAVVPGSVAVAVQPLGIGT
ncbi:MAG: hypothetical protein LC623_01770 [Halobacteriales archaeon]|nr:hypothetical protein [Halobacteriales archaeon]